MNLSNSPQQEKNKDMLLLLKYLEAIRTLNMYVILAVHCQLHMTIIQLYVKQPYTHHYSLCDGLRMICQ